MRSFNIHALGPSGSGKTVFMASLYNRLRLRRPDLAFYLKTDHESSLELNALYNKIANPAETWPEASQAVNEWRFRTVVPTPVGDFEPLEFVYLDYPGGALTNPRAMEDESIQKLVQRLRSANALLVLLDGQAMLGLLRGERAGERYLEFDIISSLEIAQQSRCPVHFAVTKWDLLQEHYSLTDLRFRLMQDENFAHLIEAKSQDMPGTIRLIPVSAVGFGFAELLPSGEMKKVGDRPRPHHVELPLLAVLPDFFQFAFAELSVRQEDVSGLKQAQELQRSFNLLGDGRMKSIMKGVLQKLMPSVQAMLMQRSPALASVLALGGDWPIDDVLDFAERVVKERADRATREHAERAAAELMQARQKVETDKAALELLQRQCLLLISDFEIETPESVLAGGIEQFIPDQAWAASFQAGASAPAAQAAPDLARSLLDRPFSGSLPAGFVVSGLREMTGAGGVGVEADIRAPEGQAARLAMIVGDDEPSATSLFEDFASPGGTLTDVYAPAGVDHPARCLNYQQAPSGERPERGETVCLVQVGRVVVVAGSDWQDDLSHGDEAAALALARAGAAHVSTVTNQATPSRVSP